MNDRVGCWKPINLRGAFEEKLQDARRSMVLAHELMESKGIPLVTAIVTAADIVSAERADTLVADGMAPEEAYRMVGSYARFAWAIKNLPRRTIIKMLPDLWSGADPDDTNPEYLQLWKEAWASNDQRYVRDGSPLPRNLVLTIYRGQVGDGVGISWTLDRKIAEKFAKTGGGRQEVEGGKVLRKTIRRRKILAYITGRGESEVIIDPKEIGKSKKGY